MHIGIMAAGRHHAAESEARAGAYRLLRATAVKASHDDGHTRGASRVIILLHWLAVHHVQDRVKVQCRACGTVHDSQHSLSNGIRRM